MKRKRGDITKNQKKRCKNEDRETLKRRRNDGGFEDMAGRPAIGGSGYGVPLSVVLAPPFGLSHVRSVSKERSGDFS